MNVGSGKLLGIVTLGRSLAIYTWDLTLKENDLGFTCVDFVPCFVFLNETLRET